MRESLAFQLMLEIGRAHYNPDAPLVTLDHLIHRLRVPESMIVRMLKTLTDSGLIVAIVGKHEHYLPARDIEQIKLVDILEAARHAEDQGMLGQLNAEPAVRRLQQDIQNGLQQVLAGQSLKQLMLSQPAEASQTGNVNSLRQRLHQLQAVIDKHDPEFIGLQETKVQDEHFPLQEIKEMGYHALYMGQKTHYGVALLSKQPWISSQLGFPDDDEQAQKRFIGGCYSIDNENWFIYNGYFPQGESRDHPVKFPAKQRFYQDLNGFIDSHHNPQQPVVIMGDFNIAPDDKDIGIGEDNARRWLRTGKTSFLPEEREWFEALCALGFYDGFRIPAKTGCSAGSITAAGASSANPGVACGLIMCWSRKS